MSTDVRWMKSANGLCADKKETKRGEREEKEWTLSINRILTNKRPDTQFNWKR